MAVKFEMTKGIDKETKKRYFKFEHKGFYITADQYGIRIGGFSPILRTQNDLDDLAQAIGAAWTQREKLKPHIHNPAPKGKVVE